MERGDYHTQGAVMFDISIQSNINEITKKLGAIAYKQVPFATASALTAIAKLVQADETKGLKATFKKASPFTMKSVRIIPARKSNLSATVFVMDKAAQYLDPYETGGVHRLSGKALLNPKDIPLNQYGQLSKGVLAKLKARPDIFIGPVKTKKGVINGVWQRVTDTQRVTLLNSKGKRLRGINKLAGASGVKGRLKLLIRFGDALPVKQRLGYRDRATRIVNANFNREFGAAMARAIASAR